MRSDMPAERYETAVPRLVTVAALPAVAPACGAAHETAGGPPTCQTSCATAIPAPIAKAPFGGSRAYIRNFMTSRHPLLAVLAAAAITSACGASGGPASGTASVSPVPTAVGSVQSPSPGPLPPGVLAEIYLTGAPLGIGTGFGSVWVENHRGHLLDRIDPATDKVTAEIDIGSDMCGLPAFGFGRVWISGCLGGEITVVDATTNQVVGSFSGGGLRVAISPDSVWVANSTGLERIDPVSLRTVATIPVPGGPEYLAYGAGSVWTTNHDDGTVSRIDAATNKVVATIPAGTVTGTSDDAFITFDFGAAWINDSTSGDSSTIWRIDPADNTARVFKVAIAPATKPALITGLDSLWIRANGGPIYRFDPTSLALIGSFPSEPDSGGPIAVGFDSIWEANPQTGTVWRIAI